MTSDPTADAIAALEQAATVVDGFLTDDPSLVYGAAHALLPRLREVRSALLSAQGQAGKPVAWRLPSSRRPGSWIHYDDLAEAERLAGSSKPEPLYVQPQPAAGASDALATARTALEAAEKALSTTRLYCADTMIWNAVIDARKPAVKANTLGALVASATSAVSSALATIKGLET